MKKINQKIWWLIILVFLTLFGTINQVLAADSQSESGKKVNFTVERADSDHQIDNEKDYFDLRVTPDETLEIQFKIKNLTKQPLTVAIDPAFGQTNDNGVISYETALSKKSEDLRTSFPELVQVESPVKLDAKEEKIVTVQIKMPAEPYSGIILGGVYFREVSANSASEQEKQKKMIAIHTDYSYLIGVQLSERDDPLEEQVDLLYVKPDQINGNNVFAVMITHPVMQILNDVKFEGKIYAKDDLSKPLYTSEQKEIRLAPNSRFQWQMELPDQRFKAGNYVLKLKVSSDKDVWEYERAFEVTQKDADRLNQKKLFVENSEDKHSRVWFIVSFVILIIGIGALIFTYWRIPKAQKWIKKRVCEWKKLMGAIKIKLFDEKVENNKTNRKKQKQHRKTKRRSGR